MATKKTNNYLESHWGAFVLQGILAATAGAYLILTDVSDVFVLISYTAIALAVLGAVEMVNTLAHRRVGHGWMPTVLISLIELAAATALILAREGHYTTALIIVASYAILRGLWELYLGTRALTDKIDKYLWTTAGIVGTVLGLVILADHGLSDTTFVLLFGIYLAVFGLVNLVYGIHSKGLLGAPASKKSKSPAKKAAVKAAPKTSKKPRSKK
jgi:uncharacterized membrane protein HdeD (DUF308 family)